MRAGLLRDIVVFQSPIITETDYSSSETIYQDVFSTHAEIKHNSGNRRIEANEISNPFTVKITIRYYHKINYDMRIVHGDMMYRILDINPSRQSNCIIITAEVINE